MKLYFQDGYGDDRFICEVDTLECASNEIEKFCNERGYHIPYWRCWGDLDKDGITYDIGSHFQFFSLKLD